MNTIPTFILAHQNEVQGLCIDLAVSQLCLFGSALREDFNPDVSDLDFLVVFDSPDAPGISDRYFSLAEGLEKIFHRPVDLVTKQSIKNQIFLDRVNSSSQTLYAA